MKKYIVLTMVISLFATTGFAGGVTDNNNGNAGNIFISTGENNGANSVGTWVNASDVPELKGAKGDTGATGATGSTGSTGQNGSNGENGTDGQNGESGENGQQGEKGTQGNQGERGKGLENRTELIGEVRIFDTRKWEGNLYAGHDFNNNVNIIGAKLTYKLGKSYEERRLDELEARLNQASTQNVIEEQANLQYANDNYTITTGTNGTTIVTQKQF